MKCKYLGHIINNNLTDDDDIARQKRCLYAQANVLARKCCLLIFPPKLLYFKHTVLVCTRLVFGAN